MDTIKKIKNGIVSEQNLINAKHWVILSFLKLAKLFSEVWEKVSVLKE